MKKILVLKGLPASGKSTYAKKLVEKGYLRVNKDDLREMLHDYNWTKKNEKVVLAARNAIIKSAMEEGFNVVVDDTNFEKKHLDVILEMVILHNSFNAYDNSKYERYELEEELIDTDVEECVRRDSLRTGRHHVGKKVIYEMYNRYLRKDPPEVPYYPDLPAAIICDIDGTLAVKCDRNIYDYSKVKDDECKEEVADIVRRYADAGYDILIVSGRDDNCWPETEDWLIGWDIPCDKLLMRKTGDRRKDSIVKKEIYDEHIKDKYNILFVLDDRDQVVQMWRSLGLTCLQVAEGNF